MKYKLVEFIDGTWGVLAPKSKWKFWQRPRFVDLTESNLIVWPLGHHNFNCCKKEKGIAERFLKRLNGTEYRIVEP